MKYIILLFAAAITITSCSSNSKQETVNDTLAVSHEAPIAHALCFLLTEGKNNTDSTSIELVIKGNKVTGLMNWLPYQKDSRKGTLAGTLSNNIINTTWTFMQEGMKDTLNLQFKLDSAVLLQKPLKLNAQTGRQQTDAAANFTLVYHTSDKIYH